ncbi:hypothetical protein EZI54_03865 [Marinobacter halodurans]|uniref:Uncharacterized protein n=1 Tax=Marinobacter halodurans TaxID=2528979 RepID=A0ABY1ZP61_9GAMM|nr:hypothetical protein [Marinobacter halodurans]TBW58530.1 hypothetical protein EZI54_03865 [Marinobacter halodurans]
MSEQQRESGRKTTVTLTETEDGMQIHVDFDGSPVDLNHLSITQGLALFAVDKLKQEIRRRYEVKREEVVRVPRRAEQH